MGRIFIGFMRGTFCLARRKLASHCSGVPSRLTSQHCRAVIFGALWLSAALLNVQVDGLKAPSSTNEGLTSIELACVNNRATGCGTFQCHNRKVVSNRRGVSNEPP